MILSDYLKQGSLFTAIFATLDNDVKAVIPSDLTLLDQQLMIEYGDKTVFDKYLTLPLESVARMLVLTNQDHWSNVVKINEVDFKLGAVSQREIVETNIDTVNTVNIRDDVNTVSAFNSDELVINDGANSTHNDNTNNDRNRNFLETTLSLSEAHNQLLLKSKSNIISILIKDVSSFLTLSIY